ncbi:MAG: pyridoxamine 5'-phosphate oxidase family protein [Deltaproteobacteria bacterium]|nr:pyridoxamine 5'-phosphate oxidase family protein [Deltaproteobacteria bacterium]
MRRKEFEIGDRQAIVEVLRKAEIGYLAYIAPDGWPRITPLNFTFDGRILWHGAVAGERFDCLVKNPRATFSAVSCQAYLPSHFVSEENATASSVAFKSVIVRGRCHGVFALIPEEMTGKFKLAQNKTEADRRKIAAQLKERGQPADLIAAEEILKTLP